MPLAVLNRHRKYLAKTEPREREGSLAIPDGDGPCSGGHKGKQVSKHSEEGGGGLSRRMSETVRRALV